MNEPIILANESLVLDGGFERGFDHWKKGSQSPDWLGIVSEEYEGVPIRFLTAGNQSSVSQSLTVPKNPGAQARYVLSFLCENRHPEAGKLVVSIEGQVETLEISLEPNAPSVQEENQARLKRGQPLAFKPISYEVELDLPFLEHDSITVSVFSPASKPDDYTLLVCITRINLQMHLESANMQELILDEQSVQPSATVHLCLGATDTFAHRLKFVPVPESTWLGTKAALTSNDNPLGAIRAMPEWGVDQPVELPWILGCPLIGDQDPYLFSMNLFNQYTAEPYPVTVSLGHHRLVFRDVLEAAYYPVLEYGQSVQLGVQVASYYTGHALSGRTVTWTLEGQGVKGTGVTNEQGWAYFNFTAQAHGNVVIQASVDSPYYAAGEVTQALDVRVLATDPWKDLLAVVEGVETLWEEKTGYPNRGSNYLLTVKLPTDSPLLDTELSLHWSGDSHEQLGVVVSPALEHSVPVIGLEMAWTLTSADRLDGRFYLELACSKLLSRSPKKLMSLARNLVKVGEVREANKFPVVDENESVLLRVKVRHVVVSGDGDPVNNAWVDWITPEGTISTRSGAGGWASVLYAPKVAGDQVVKASIKAHAEAVAVEQPFNVKAIATSPWKSEVKFLLDAVEVERNALGVLCRRGQTHTLKVVPVSGSAWVGKNISLHWRGAAPDIGLEPSELGVLKPLVAAGVEWKLVSQVNDSVSSLFELELRLDGVSTVRELSGRLMSADLTEEVSLMLDQIPAALDTQAFYPCLGALHRFNVLPNALSPLVGLESLLTWSGTPADQLGATVQPALDLPQNLSDGGTTWTLDFTASQAPGDFSLTLTLPQLNFVASAKPMRLAHNKVRIEAWRESPVDPVVGQVPAWQWVQVFSHFTQRAVSQVPVTWTTPQGPSVVHSDNDGWSGVAFAPAIADTHQVEAWVVSPFDGFEDKRAMGVTALANDPWAGLKVKFDGGPAHVWGEKTYFPRRKGKHTFELLAAENSPLFDRDLTLGMKGTGPDELGVRFVPEALGVPRKFFDVVNLQYEFEAGDLKDASFALRLSSQRLASLSPANAMSLGEGAQVVKITGNSRVDQTLDWGQEFFGQVTVVSVISGRPMVGWTVTWRSPDLGIVTSETDFYGVARVRFVPQTPGEAELTATVGDRESVALSYFLNEPREIQSLFSPKPNGHLGELVSAVVTVISARTGAPLQDVEVMWDYPDRTIAPTRTDVEGNARVEFRMPGIRRGLLQATVPGGYAGWEVQTIQFELVPHMTTSTSTSTWLQEFRLFVNDVEVDWFDVKLNLVAEKNCTLKLDYKYSWLIGEPEGFLALEYKPGAEGQDLNFDPPLGELAEMAEGTTSLSWTIFTEQAHSGPFVLQFALPKFEQLAKSPPLPGAVLDVGEELEVEFDEFPVTFGASAYPCHGAKHTITVRPKPSSQFLNTPIKLVWGGEPAEKIGVVVTPSLVNEQVLTLEGVTWELSCLNTTQNGDFSLQLLLVESGAESLPLAMSLGHNLVKARHWMSGPHWVYPDLEYYHSHVQATSVFLNTPASQVGVSVNDGPPRALTDANGEHVNKRNLSLKIVNRYDGTVV